ncbi:MAG: hypothetical protein ABIJ97_08365 [Bacteroidota bacterium]
MKIIAISIISILLISTACNKKKYPKLIHGTVRDITTQNVVPNATIYLYDVEGGFTWSQSFYDSLICNKSGEFYYSLNDDINLDILVDHPNYVKSDWFYINEDKYEEIILAIQPIGYISFHCINIDTILGSSITITPYFDYNPNLSSYNGDTTIVGPVYGNNLNDFSYIVHGTDTHSGMSQYFINVYCKAFDTTYYEILY